jgi:hypothetical protein
MAKSRGLLLIPAGAKILQAEPGLPKLTKKGALLFHSLPKFAPEKYKLGLFSPNPKSDESLGFSFADKNITVQQVTTKAGEEEAWVVAEKFYAPQVVLARPHEETFEFNDEKKDVTSPFSHLMHVEIPDQKTIGGKYRESGWMFKKDLKGHQEEFVPFEGDIFTRLPSKVSIKQGAMGNCFLLSSILSILSDDRGAEFVMNHMRQIDDHSTIVKLYDPRTLTPVYIKVENSYLSNIKSKDSAVLHEEFWVHLYEKAYAALGMQEEFVSVVPPKSAKSPKDEKEKKKGEIDKFVTAYTPTYPSFSSAYGSGGDPVTSLSILTGQKVETFALFEALNILNPNEIMMAVSMGDSLNRLEASGATGDVLKNRKAALIAALEGASSFVNVFEDSPDLIFSWWKYVANLSDKHPKAFQELESIVVYGNALNQKEIYDWIEKLKKLDPAPSSELLEAFGTAITRTKKPAVLDEHKGGAGVEKEAYLFAGPVGSGQYTQFQLDIFKKLEDALVNKKAIVTAATFKVFPEEGVPGLVNGHAYAVLGVVKKQVGEKEILCVRLRNPWGQVGRMYDFPASAGPGINLASPRSDAKAVEFDLDISEFQKYFERYFVGALPRIEPELDLSAGVRAKAA